MGKFEVYAYRTEVRTVPALGWLYSDAKGATRTSPRANGSGSVRRANSMWRRGLFAMCNSDTSCCGLHVDRLIGKQKSSYMDENAA
jgi:hypothetical protein